MPSLLLQRRSANERLVCDTLRERNGNAFEETLRERERRKPPLRLLCS
jgi:hypothetical protein